MQVSIPRTLPFQGRIINYAGAGRAPGSHMFLDATTGNTLELFFAQVVRTGAHYSLAAVFGNNAVGQVRVDHASLNGHGAPAVADLLIVGPLQFPPDGPRAVAAWFARIGDNGTSRRPFEDRRAHRPAGTRRSGVIARVDVHGTFGWIHCDQTRLSVFVHQSQLRNGARLIAGSRVSFVEAVNDRGPAAYDVLPA